jgi:uncharacterized protein YbjQ (UPF0145 family)
MIITASDMLAEKRIVKTLGLVKGNCVRAQNLGKNLLAFFHNLAGGEVETYTKLLAELREQAKDRMIAQALRLGANAIVNVRYSTSYVMGGVAEFLAYGTAVVVE